MVTNDNDFHWNYKTQAFWTKVVQVWDKIHSSLTVLIVLWVKCSDYLVKIATKFVELDSLSLPDSFFIPKYAHLLYKNCGGFKLPPVLTSSNASQIHQFEWVSANTGLWTMDWTMYSVATHSMHSRPIQWEHSALQVTCLQFNKQMTPVVLRQ